MTVYLLILALWLPALDRPCIIIKGDFCEISPPCQRGDRLCY